MAKTVTTSIKATAKVGLRLRSSQTSRLPYRYTLVGTLKLPRGVGRAVGCSGTVTLTLTDGSQTIGAHRAKVDGKCRYDSSFKLLSMPAGHIGRQVKASARYGGNATLTTGHSKTVTLARANPRNRPTSQERPEGRPAAAPRRR